MRRSALAGPGLGFGVVTDDPGVQLVVIATGLIALLGGTGWQVTWLLALAAAWLALRLPRSGPADEDPGHGGGGGGGMPDRPTPIPPTGTATM